MRSNNRKPAEEAPSSLEDSAYEVLGESSYEISDDEGRTESLASTEGQTPDDISSVADTEEGSDDGYAYEPPGLLSGHLLESTKLPFIDHARNELGESSILTSRAESHPSNTPFIELNETQSRVQEALDGCGIVRTFETHKVPEVLQPYMSPEVRITVRMTLSQRSLTLNRHFRIMYVGDVPRWAKNDISEQIAAALTANCDPSLESSRSSQNSSRFSIVQIPSFNEGNSSTKVQLIESSRYQLLVDQCVDAVRLESNAGGAKPVIQITKDDKTQLLFGPGKCVQVRGESCTPHLPDLAVFCHNTGSPISDSVVLQQQCQLVQEAFQARSIPILNIAMVRPFHQCPASFCFNSETLRLCVEGRTHGETRYQILETLPIDVFSFCEIIPAQLNRHLAYITESGSVDDQDSIYMCSDEISQGHKSHSSERAPKVIWTGQGVPVKVQKQWSRVTMAVWQNRKLQVLLTLAALATILVSLAVRQTAHVLHINEGTGNVDLESFAPTLTPSRNIARTPSTLMPTDVTMTSVVPTSKDLTVASPEISLGHPIETSDPPDTQGLDDFQIHVTGNDEFILTPPIHLTKMKRPPQLYVQVVRDAKGVPSVVSKLNESAYIVTLEQENGHGLLNVTVWTKTRPLLSRTVEIRVGPRWPYLLLLAERVEKLPRLLQKEVAFAQVGFKDISSRFSKGMQEGYSHFEEGTTAALRQTIYWGHRAEQATRGFADRLEDAKREAAQQFNIGYNVTKKMSNALYLSWDGWAGRTSDMARSISCFNLTNVWQQTSAVRKSQTMLDARKTALKMWQKLGQPREEARETPASVERVNRCKKGCSRNDKQGKGSMGSCRRRGRRG